MYFGSDKIGKIPFFHFLVEIARKLTLVWLRPVWGPKAQYISLLLEQSDQAFVAYRSSNRLIEGALKWLGWLCRPALSWLNVDVCVSETALFIGCTPISQPIRSSDTKRIQKIDAHPRQTLISFNLQVNLFMKHLAPTITKLDVLGVKL